MLVRLDFVEEHAMTNGFKARKLLLSDEIWNHLEVLPLSALVQSEKGHVHDTATPQTVDSLEQIALMSQLLCRWALPNDKGCHRARLFCIQACSELDFRLYKLIFGFDI